MYINTYLDRIGDFINLCMKFAKTGEGYEEIETLSDQLRDPGIIEDMFLRDVRKIMTKLDDKKITRDNAIDSFDKLRVYVLTQLEKHYDLINELLHDTEEKVEVDVSFTKDGREFPQSLKKDIMKVIDDADREVREKN
jgi:hypothetical protein